MKFTIELKHDTAHRTWKRLSVVTLSTEALKPQDYLQQYAIDNQMNPDQLAYRVLEIDSSMIGTSKFTRIVEEKESAATINRDDDDQTLLHVYAPGEKFVAIINKQSKLADGYCAEEPWLLLHNTGRTDRFARQSEAKEEAMKSWGKCRFERHAKTK